MADEGWVKWHRRLLDNPLMSLAPSVFKTFGCLLLMANYQDAKWYDGEQEITIPRGTLVTSRANLGRLLHITDQQCRDSLFHLQRLGIIRTNSRPNRYTVISICNYERYQSCSSLSEPTPEQVKNQPGTNSEPTRNGSRTTTKEGKKEEEEVFMLDSPLPRPARSKPIAVPESDEFKTFYAAYWRHVGREDAWKAYRENVHNGDATKVLAAMMEERPEQLGREKSKRPHPATWLNGHRWRDREGLTQEPKAFDYREFLEQKRARMT